MSEQISGLAFIDAQEANPFALFKQWRDEVTDAGCTFFQTNTMCLATSTKNGKVSNRNVVLKEFSENGFTFVTTKESRKFQEIQENPWVAATFLWNYSQNGKNIVKQVRIEGQAFEISSEKCKTFYEHEEFYCKIRAHLCHQDQEVDWEVLKQEHDTLVNDVINNQKEIPMPDYYVGYQIVPEHMDFYYAWANHIADRVVFTKKKSGWNFVHVAA